VTVITRKNHAMFFNGITDSIVVPEGAFSTLGDKTTQDTYDVRNILSPDAPLSYRSQGATSGAFNGYITIEAWVIPDCGGTVIEKEGQFRLSLGNIDTPGPAVFVAHLTGDQGDTTVTLTTANEESNRYEGTVYPHIEYQGIQDSYNRFVSGSDDATDLNKNHRPLIHVVAAVRPSAVELYVNGAMVASESTKDKGLTLRSSSHRTFIGGEGGRFRGTMEGIHISAAFNQSMVDGNGPYLDAETLLLYRFEEPISPIEGVFTFSSIANNSTTIDGVSVTVSQISMSSADATTLAKSLTGLSSVTSNYVFSKDSTGVHKYSSGDYKVLDYQSGSLSTHAISHTPYNLLINPDGIDPDTKAPNSKPPERVRLHSINVDTGNLLVSSIHLDFASSTNGMIPALHTRSTGVDNHFVVVSSDLLLDSATGNPYQPPHFTSQIIDRTGQMVIDESEFQNHGFVYSSAMATTSSDTNNPFAATWPTTVDEAYQIGHSGRHTNNHVEGHCYLRMLPKSSEEIIDQRADGSADVIEIIYDEVQTGIHNRVSINSMVDIYREFGNMEVVNVVDSSTVTVAFNSYNGTGSPPTGKRKLIAIGGPNFDYTPFALKGPVPPFQVYDSDDAQTHISDDIRKYHVKPSKESRVAILHVPRLTQLTPTLAPFVEIHYNAIDLTGASMSGTVQPLLMVEKTVPSSDTLVSGSEYVYDAIINSIASGHTLFSPGGYIDVDTEEINVGDELLYDHSFVGDTSEGFSSDDEVDESLTPANYTPRNNSDSIQNQTPGVILESTSTTGDHDSVFHRLYFNQVKNTKLLTDKGSYDRLEPDVTPNSPAAGQFDTGTVTSATPIYEMYDVIDNFTLTGNNSADMRIILQPTDRRRSMLLSNVNISGVLNRVSILYMMSRAKVRSIDETVGEQGGIEGIRCVGVADSIVSRRIDFTGKGSPDSHIVKEIEPNAPVVTVSLGGPGQGAMDTRPVFQKSILAHESYSTRRSYSVTAHQLDVNWSTGAATLHVKPLNNESTDLASWGTYGFPRYGRIHLPDGSSAKYDSKTGSTFVFSAASASTLDFLSSDGTSHLAVGKLLNATGFMVGPTSGTSVTINGNFTVFSEADFGNESDLENGTTLNDRMHQSLNDVQHDYQLGTQYASTRAIAEIPLFSEQFFHDSVGPGNAFKIHVDATHTAHTYNPSPVGRRFKSENELADREAKSAFSIALQNREYLDSTFAIKWDTINRRLYVNNINIFPDSTTSTATYKGVTTAYRYRKVHLANGEWSWYTSVNRSDGYLQLLDATYGQSPNFFESLAVGISVFINDAGIDSSLIPISSDEFTPSSDFENRDEYHHDAASVKTQGGNVDYGLRQYVSAVEFKAGPESNPHAPRVDVKRATGKVLTATVTRLTGVPEQAVTITLSEEDFAKFPDLGYDTLANAPSSVGDLGYEVQYDDNGTVYSYQYHGHIKTINSVATPKNSITLVFQTSGATYPLVDTGVLINRTALGGGSYAQGTTSAMIVDGVDATTIFTVGDLLFQSDGSSAGEITAVSSTAVTVGGGTTNGAFNDNEELKAAQGFPEGVKITLTSKRRSILGTSVTTEVSDGSQYYRELKNSLNITDVTVTAQSADSSSPFEITVDGASGKNVNDLHGTNVKKGDILYYLEDTSTDKIRRIGIVSEVESADANGTQIINMTAATPVIPSNAKIAVWMGDYEEKDAVLNATWLNPYSVGGFRDGDTVWANMSYNNPHAVEGLFAKSRGVYNESQVWNAFNGGAGELDTTNPRDSIPLENFMIGNTCLETARNYVQHVNRTVEENYLALGLTVSQAPTVAFIDPYLSNDDHARVLLYDVAHDKEFIAFQDIHMQVQTSPDAVQIGWPKEVVEDGGSTRSRLHKVNAVYNGAGPSPWTTQIDVTNGFLSQNPYIRSTQQSKFIESAYAHDLSNRHTEDLLDSTTFNNQDTNDFPTDGRSIAGARLYGKSHGHYVHTGYSYGGAVDGLRNGYSLTPRTNDSVSLHKIADPLHDFTRIPVDAVDSYTDSLIDLRKGTSNCTFRDPATFFDTPDGTRVIPAFLCLKGIRNTSLDLSSHEETRLQHLPQWKDMGFVRRLTIDLGEVAEKDGVVNTLSGAEEVVRMINQHAALNARLLSGSAHDPAPFWHTDNGDRGTHMGYIRAHIGREVQDLNGDVGFTIVLHSTVPGASGRNFCAWLDNSTGQTSYQPQFLVGHGGRWRNFWALPDEREGENMHPAPMPLDKNGRPFAPITTLQQYVTSIESGEDVRSVADFEDTPVMRAVSDSISGKNHNSINVESLDIKGSSSSLVRGLRTGPSALARVNFGGLVASGVPGFAPDAGSWGFGFNGESKFNNRYGTTSTSTYSSHVPTSQVSQDAVGIGQIYGLSLTDNLGRENTLRYIYRTMGESFSNSNTSLPDTIEEEVCVFIDDRDVSQGGFTIGSAMSGSGDATGRMSFSAVSESLGSWRGAKWRGVAAPNAATLVTAVLSSETLSITFVAPFDASFTDDKLGYLGFPKEDGIIQISDYDGAGDANVGLTLSYTHRSGTVFYGVTGVSSLTSTSYLISSVLNQTTLVTDELLAAVTAAAINAGDEVNSLNGHTFDCTDMYAFDGKTFGEWGVSPNAIKIRAYNPNKRVKPLNTSYNASVFRDLGIQAAHLEFGEVEKVTRPTGTASYAFGTSRAVTDANIDASRNIDCGYVPYTVLQVRTTAKGPMGNTASPNLVDSKNVVLNTNKWSRGLKGMDYTRYSGDHILPSIDNPHSIYTTGFSTVSAVVVDGEFAEGHTGAIAIDGGNSNVFTVGDLIVDAADRVLGRVTATNTTTSFSIDELRVNVADTLQITRRKAIAETTKDWQSTVTLGANMFQFLIPACTDTTGSRIPSFGERKRIYLTNEKSIVVESKVGTNAATELSWDIDDSNNMPREITFEGNILSTHFDPDFNGLRSIGSVFSEPIVHFRGGKSSRDHSVPLFFGGGFSGVVLDVNDGTTNDYSSFYTHPYANGPTGVSGIQNASEISTSFAMLDTNAMFAFFPGAALCNQHRGSITPPVFNKQNILSPDLNRGSSTYTSGVVKAKPVPMVLRFAHPTARYEDHVNSIDSKTTYLIFGPGQAFPFTNEAALDSESGTTNAKEPYPGRIITSGNTWASVPFKGGYSSLGNDQQLFPNSIENSRHSFLPPRKDYYNTTAGFHWRAMVNWESPAGYTMKEELKQRPEHGRHYGQQLNDDTPYDANDLTRVTPKMHTPTIGFGITMAADTVWHMDGGYHPGGSWLDNQLTFNPPHKGKSDSRVLSSNWERANQIHPTAFRVAGPLTDRILDYVGNGSEAVVSGDVDMEYIVVDATRCQNGEELATVLGAAINAFPGAGSLKALGGTHMPSMGNAMRQDRYGWRHLGTLDEYNDSSSTGNYIDSEFNDGDGTTFTQEYLEQLPTSGWLRAIKESNGAVAWVPYHSREVLNESSSNWKVRFYMAPNRIHGQSKAEDPQTWEDFKAGASADFAAVDDTYTLYVWSKAGTLRFNNENVSTRDHMTQVHFSGIADAVDRTRPVGAIGWHGERYSYLNSLKITKNTSGTGYAAGLGAHHPMLNFSPYGTAGTVMNTHSNVPVVAPIRNSPESTPTIDGIGIYVATHVKKANFYTKYNLTTGSGGAYDTYTYAFTHTEDTTNDANQWNVPTNYIDNTPLPKELTLPQGLYTSAFLVVSYDSESSLVAKFDRDGITANGDWLQVIGQSTNPITYAGNTQWDERFHGQDRFIAPANAGPNVEALIVDSTTVPIAANLASANWAATTFSGISNYFHGDAGNNTAQSNELELKNAVPGLNKIGDLLFDLDHSVGSVLLESGDAERNTSADSHTTAHTTNWPANYWLSDVNAFQMYEDSAAHNFSVENVVWKRMDGGNLSLPAINARGLGAVPWVTRVKSNAAILTGEKLYGNVRFSFETTNSAMMPVLQAQELSHPEFARKHPYKVGNVLDIPNEEVQFQSINVRDDSGQMHKIEGGSPLGTIIRGFRVPENRGVDGRAPALANSGKEPNLKVQLPDPNSIPGNIVVRSGYDPIQAYQNETMGTGGMHHPDLGSSVTTHLFDNSVSSPRQGPTYENHNWERINPVSFDSELGAWNNNSPLNTSYELHDRTLYFHVTKMGHSHSHRYPAVYTHAGGVENDVVSVTAWNSSTSVLTIDAVLDTDVFAAGFGTVQDTRKFLRVYNPTTDEGAVCSYTAQGSTSITVVGDVNFATFMAGQTVTDLKVVPSYYIPAGSNRFFAARRLRDHAEVSGNSPDMANTLYHVSGQTVGFDAYSKPVMTPMPYPRMGHHFVTPTMPMLPGHWAHPAYQSLYRRHLADFNSTTSFHDAGLFDKHTTAINKLSGVETSLGTSLEDNIKPLDSEINFSGVNAAPSLPSDIHGGAFTLMFETSVKYDGYGVLASSDKGTDSGSATALAGTVNKAGGHSIVLEAASEYTLGRHFPDPAEVGAYQIVIQPNLFNHQLVGYHNNSTTELTSQQINTVIGIKKDAGDSNDKGGLTLVLAKATNADVRGCEVFINEKILDVSNDPGSQFTNIPPLMSYNHIGAQLTESPAFTRRGFPYSKMFSNATPAHTLHIPWWSILHKNGIQYNGSAVSEATNYRKLTQYSPDDYYLFMRSTFGSVGSQLTINGYTSLYLDIYDKYRRSISISPKCIVQSFNTSGTIVVDNANTFPMFPYYEQEVQYTAKNGNVYSKALASVDGNTAATVNIPKTLNLASKSGADGFWDNMFNGAILTLTHSYDTLPAGDIITDTSKSVFANILPDIIDGNQDTNSRFVPDAFLCMWHHNLGRPNTYFSDNTSRSWKGAPVNKAQYNSMPEHFETIHYHDFTHSISTGPFDFLIKRPNITRDGQVTSGNSTHDAGGTNVMLSGFWPCGSRGGPHASKLDLYGMASASWNVHATSTSANFSSDSNLEWVDSDDDGSYAVSSGIATGSMATTRRRPYGHRNAVRQAYNRPRYDLYPPRALYEATASGSGQNTTNYDAGPLVQTEAYSSGWLYGGGAGDSAATKALTYVGVMERQTNFTGMLNQDQEGWQVRYSDGRRMTRPFGTPVRTIRNPTGVERDWWGDIEGKGITSLSIASQHYLVDWWGNERGEDVRRTPVRGFGIRPSWDCADAYDIGTNSAYARIYNSGKPLFNLKGIADLTNGNISVTTNYTIPRFGGVLNSKNNNSTTTLVDVFSPVHSLRIGDMGNGRGVRYPTAFNESLLTEISSPNHKTGIVLSHNTAEPLFGDGLLRPRNDVLQADEVKRGISAKLGIDDNGLLKSEATVSDRVEEVSGTTVHKDPVSRTSPRIGIDAEVVEGVEQSHVVINTEAHSLHTDRNVGQRVVLQGSMQIEGSLTDANYNTMSFSRQTAGSTLSAAHKYSHTNAFRPYGGSYIIETKSYSGLFDDTGWGVASLTGSNDTSNPYQDATNYTSDTVRNNEDDRIVRFVLRPIRVLDANHVEVFRIHNSLNATSPQHLQNYLHATSGGKYGIFTYETPNGRAPTANLSSGRAVPDTNGPYLPIFTFDPTGAFETPSSMGPKLLGSEVSGFSNALSTDVSRLIITENTLQHHRSDAPRRRVEKETDDETTKSDFTVKPRFSQSLHNKGHKGDVSFNVTDHSGDGA